MRNFRQYVFAQFIHASDEADNCDGYQAAIRGLLFFQRTYPTVFFTSWCLRCNLSSWINAVFCIADLTQSVITPRCMRLRTGHFTEGGRASFSAA